MNMKFIVTFFFLLFIGITLNTKGQDSPVFTIENTVTTASASTVPITTVGFSDIRSDNLKILYNSDIVNPTAVTRGSDLGGTLNVNFSCHFTE